MKKIIALFSALLLVLGVAACKKTTATTTTTKKPTTSSSVTASQTSKSTDPVKQLANGAYSYVAASYEERTKILGLLEAYAVKNFLTGVSLFENGGYSMYNKRIVKGTETYISGYGFGILAEGNITADLAGETNPEYARYYHIFETDDPASLNYLNSQDAVTGDLYGYVSSGYWSTKMNDTKDGYEWYPVLAKEKPIAVDMDPVTQLASTYKFRVKTGADGLKYNTTSTKNAEFAGRDVALEDYVYAWKFLLTKKNGQYRGTEMLDGAGTLVGSQAYYDASADGADTEAAKAAWEKVGIKAYEKDGESWLEFKLNVPATPFYAMYYLASSLYMPIPEEFMNKIGGAASYGTFTDAGDTPIDTMLCLSPYMTSRWEKDVEIVFKKNPLWNEPGRYQIPGIHIKVLAAQKTDSEAALKEFLANKLDAVGIPSTRLAEFINDDRTTQTLGDSVFKLNVNTTTQEEWIKLFGENGTIKQTAEKDYYQVKPIMSNKNFLMGLSFSLNRKEFAENKGRIPSQNYFSSDYLSDPENGVSYNTTPEHLNAIKDFSPETYGYDLDIAKAYFKQAVEELVAQGKYTLGTKENPTKISIDIWWQTETNVTQYGNDIAQYIETAFNDESVAGGKIQLKVNNYTVAVWSDVYYKKMMVGQFDLGFGSVSGNALNPLNFMEVLRSDNTSNFTLNWGVDTGVVSDDLFYDGVYWSYNALWQAADTGAYVVDGVVSPTFDAELKSNTTNEDGTQTIVIDYTAVQVEGVEVSIDDVVICWYEGEYNEYGMDSEKFTCEIKDGKITIVASQELVEEFYGEIGIDIYYTAKVKGVDGKGYKSLYDSFPNPNPAPAE